MDKLKEPKDFQNSVRPYDTVSGLSVLASVCRNKKIAKIVMLSMISGHVEVKTFYSDIVSSLENQLLSIPDVGVFQLSSSGWFVQMTDNPRAENRSIVAVEEVGGKKIAQAMCVSDCLEVFSSMFQSSVSTLQPID